MANNVFDASKFLEENPDTDYSPIPVNEYDLMAVGTKLIDTKNEGKMLIVEIDVQKGEYAGRKIFQNFNVVNKNPQTETIAYKELAKLIHAMGKTTIKFSPDMKEVPDLHNKRFRGLVGVEPPQPKDKNNPDGEKYAAKNSIKKYLPVGTVSPSTSTSGSDSAPNAVEQKSEQKAVPPWKKSKS